MYYSSEGEYPNNLKVGDPIESSDGAVYMPRFPKAPSTVESGCDSSEYHYEQKEAGASYEISFCLGSKIGDLEAGGITASPGGVSGFVCGDSFTDFRDGNIYTTVKIGNQCWMAENLNIGIKISGALNQENTSIIEKYCYTGVDDYCDIYGGLYQWNQAMNYEDGENENKKYQGICPDGWHLPNNSEWAGLENYLGGYSVAGEKMKSITSHWHEIGEGTTNESGFTALPGGFRNDIGNFFNMFTYVYFWSASPGDNGSHAWSRCLGYEFPHLFNGYDLRTFGYSVRCLRN